MILLYHKVADEAKSHWWVSSDQFYRQLVQLQSKKVVYLDDYNPNDPSHVVITFDGVYTNILKYAAPLLAKFNYPFELFITNDYIGKQNEFDNVEPAADFADIEELKKLTKLGGRLQWHTKTHRDITTLNEDELSKEIITPATLKKLDNKGFKWFAYAYGKYSKAAQKLVEKNYTGGLACENGSYNDKSIWPRLIVTEKTELMTEKVSVIIPCHNYAQFLSEAIESVLRQTYLPDEIILSDDASEDHSFAIMEHYAALYPELIKARRNEKNMGIVKHFNQAVKESQGDFICFIGADNRVPGHYIEECIITLRSDDKVAIAYTDFALFGNRAEKVYNEYYKPYKGEKVSPGVYTIIFPEFDKKSMKTLLTERNFIHGSSMYKRKAFHQVKGYLSREKQAEDYSLFQNMVKNGYLARKANNVFLEYRQHSSDQANNQFALYAEVEFLRSQFQNSQHLRQVIGELTTQLSQAEEELRLLKNTKAFWARKQLGRTRYVFSNPHKIPKIIRHVIRKAKKQ